MLSVFVVAAISADRKAKAQYNISESNGNKITIDDKLTTYTVTEKTA